MQKVKNMNLFQEDILSFHFKKNHEKSFNVLFLNENPLTFCQETH